ncbi:hypothetical protein AwErysi_09630 [Erysipelotrichaceae bacterium]|nr:hypothetical protein AwErysi_09630 [Erysipelotrichaceae bacterium]
MLRFEAVRKSYQNTLILKDLSFTIHEGECIVFLGASGSGKTTTLKMINRLETPSSGEIYYHGQPIINHNVYALRKNMGYVIQNSGLFPHMQIDKNIGIVPSLTANSMLTTEITKALEQVGLDDSYAKRYPLSLSGGQQQRVGIARALANNPDILLMDEPFSALDVQTRGQLQQQLKDIQQSLNKTIVFVTHDMREAFFLADRIFFFNDQQIIAKLSPEQFLRSDIPAIRRFLQDLSIWDYPAFLKVRDILPKLAGVPIAQNTQTITLEHDIPLTDALEQIASATDAIFFLPSLANSTIGFHLKQADCIKLLTMQYLQIQPRLKGGI